jgi:broad specificity phosphatase PhoE
MARPTIYFARHGQTDWNAEKRLQGQHDIPLNALGLTQAVQAGGVLRELLAEHGHRPGDLDYVSSPLSRARDTMELMRKGIGLPASGYRIDPRLMEMSFGRWEGYTFEDLREKEAPALAAREADKWGFVLPEGESYGQLLLRVREWYESVDRDTVVAAHGGVCRVLIAHLGIEPIETAPVGEIGQGVIYVFVGERMTRHG